MAHGGVHDSSAPPGAGVGEAAPPCASASTAPATCGRVVRGFAIVGSGLWVGALGVGGGGAGRVLQAQLAEPSRKGVALAELWGQNVVTVSEKE